MSVTDYYAALQQHLQAMMGDRVETIGDYEVLDDGRLNTPAILIDIERIEIGDDRGDDRLPLALSVVVYCVLSIKTTDVQKQVRVMATEVMRHLRYFSVAQPELVALSPERMSGGVGPWRSGEHGYESHEITFTQQIGVGASVWEPDGITPDTVYLGIDPEIGVPHEPDYEQVTGLPPP